MKPYPITVILVTLAGCSAPLPTVHPDLSRPARPVTTHDPYVLIVGDAMVTSWGTPEVKAANPQWIFAGSAPGAMENTGSILQRTPAAIINGNPLNPGHPDVVVILAGVFDLVSPGWQQPCGGDDPLTATCSNIQQMTDLAVKAGAKVIVCNIPGIEDIGSGPISGSTLLAQDPGLQADEGSYAIFLEQGFENPDLTGWKETALLSLNETAIGMGWTDNGVTPNASGAELFTSLVQAAVAPMKAGGAL